jgi:hypothetical protein
MQAQEENDCTRTEQRLRVPLPPAPCAHAREAEAEQRNLIHSGYWSPPCRPRPSGAPARLLRLPLQTDALEGTQTE